MTRVHIWDEELEPLRAEARAATEQALPLFARLLGSPDMPPKERLALQRASYDKLRVPLDGPTPELTEEVIAGQRCRVFVPEQEPIGLYVQIHGGGMTLGSPEDGDVQNLRRCRELGLVVVSPQYRLAPEHPYPALFEDVLGVVLWLLDNAEKRWGVGSRIVIGGGSAGAYITAGTVLRLRDQHDAIDRVAGMNLEVGLFDLNWTPSLSGVRCTDGPDVLDDPLLKLQLGGFTAGLSAEQLRDPAVSPLHADLRPMPRALLTAGLDDHLIDDSLFFAQRLAAAGNWVDLRVYPDSFHGFLTLQTGMAARARAAIDQFLVDCYATSI